MRDCPVPGVRERRIYIKLTSGSRKVTGFPHVRSQCSPYITALRIDHHTLQQSSKQHWKAVMCADHRELNRRDGRDVLATPDVCVYSIKCALNMTD